jgi:predicted  nucleic acid-binding Zn-ribbon protein
MNDTLASLLKLQEQDLSLEEQRRTAASVAPRRAGLEDALRLLQSAFEESKKSLTDAQLLRKSLEAEAEAKDQAVRKHSGDLNSVKSNDAYKALLSEIENAKKEKSDIEDKVLEVMETQENLQRELKSREKTLASEKAVIEKELAALEAEEKRLASDVAAKSAEREAYFQSLPEDGRRSYETVRRGRAAFAVLAEVNDMTCFGCRTKIPADVVNNIMKGKDLVNCDSCSRILFIRPAPPPVAEAAAS